MKVVALAGGIGGGKFLRGLVRAVPPNDVVAVVNTGDDLWMHGLRICPDLDSVTYWLGDAFDRERGWGRRDETFRATEELRRFDPEAAWFGLGDLDLATHLYRTRLLADGRSLSEITALVAARFGIAARILPMSDDDVTTRVDVVSFGQEMDLHFQEYWVQRGGRDDVKGVRFQGLDAARPAPGRVGGAGRGRRDRLRAVEPRGLDRADPGGPGDPRGDRSPTRRHGGRERDHRRGTAGGDGRPADAGGRLEVTAAGAASAYQGLLRGWLIDERDRELAPRIERDLGIRVAVADTIMVDDDAAEAVARAALRLLET